MSENYTEVIKEIERKQKEKTDYQCTYEQIIKYALSNEVKRIKIDYKDRPHLVMLQTFYGSHMDWVIFQGIGNTEKEAENNAAKKFNKWLNTSEYAQWFREDLKGKNIKNERNE